MDKETLLKFCDPDIARVSVPFTRGEFTYATNGHIGIIVPKIDDIPDNPKAPLFDKLEIGEADIWVSLDEFKPNTIDCKECEGEGVNCECPECNGVGEVDFSNSYSNYTCDCATCDGDGKIDRCEACNGTGKVITGTYKIGDASFEQKYLALLKELPNCMIGVANKYEVHPFKFDGGTGAIMPIQI